MYVRVKAWDDAKQHASVVLEVPEIHGEQRAKASYILALAYTGLKDWKPAQIALEVANRRSPDDSAIRKALAVLEKERRR